MAKAKLTTRGISASTVTSDNLAKGSQLTHNQLDSNFINLRDQSFGIAADDSATIQVGAGDTLYIQGGTNVTTSTDSAGVVTINASTSGDSLGDLTAVGSTLSSPSNAAITLDPSGTGTIELNANTNVTGDFTTSAISLVDNTISTSQSNANLELEPSGTGEIRLGANIRIVDNSTQSIIGNLRQDAGNNLQISTIAAAGVTAGGGIDIAPRGGTQHYGAFRVTTGSQANSDANKAATIETDNLRFGGSAGNTAQILGLRSNEDISIQPAGAGNIILGAVKINGTTLSSDDSTKITVAEAVDVTGALVAGTSLTLATGATVTGVDNGALGTSATLLATQGAIKTYVDASVSGIGGDITSVVAGTGMTGGGTTSDVTLNVIGGTGITANANDIAIDSTVATLTGSQTLTNKVLTAPTINAATMTGNVTVDNLIFNDNIISSDSNADIRIEPGGTGKITSTGVVSLTDDTSTSPNLLIAGGGSTGDFTLKLGNHPSRANQGNSIYADGSALYLESSTNSIILQNSALTIAADRGITFESTAGGSGAGTIKNLNLDIINNTISSKQSNEDIELDPNGSGVVNVKSSKITNVTDPGAAQDAATKAYVDANVLSLIDEDNMSTNSATRPPSQQSVKAYVDAEVSGAGGGGLKVIGDDSAGVDIAGGGTLYVQGGTGITTATDSAGVITINGQVGDVTSVVAGAGLTGGGTDGDVTLNVIGGTGITANANDIAIDSTVTTLTGTQELTNKTLTSAVLKTGVSGTAILDEDAMGTNSDTQLATQQSIKAYADTKAVLSGSTNNNVATVTGAHALVGEGNLTFNGSTLAVTGAATVSTTLGVTGASTLDGITITDNTISTNASNANLELGTNGTGLVAISGDGSQLADSGSRYTDFFGGVSNIKNFILNKNQEVDASSTGKTYANLVNMDTKMIGSSSGSNSNFRPRNMLVTNTVDTNGLSYTRSGFSRGPVALTFGQNMMNTGGSASTIKNVRGFDAQAGIYVESTGNLASDLTLTDVFVANATVYSADESSGASGTPTVTNGYSYRSSYYMTSGDVITNVYAYYNEGAEDATATNRYAFYSTDAAASSRMGAIRLDNQSGDPTHGDGFGWIYAKDDSGSSEVHVKDEAGNVTKISPHNDAGEWEYYSKNSITGKTVRVNMEAMIKEVEKLSGKTFIETE